ncbi:thiolase family protein [Convivina intestini]|uniref:acetyl-CoA C-acetyltransferase n=1 Tax=Convivina intestini TaxID=1505726 RepID=A0A2U1DC97_9LACO|nr:thiolase family protein [Convivina intestini]PVY85229.1 acetyl-CoA C-acetyltransferase [Convivina intestini]CAH1852514.1 putative acetyl-CoA acyltransferase [Convivina intestini]CAH1854619.1 putative acetyl-CoA acyltransferase [Convivina intestini]SDC01470.1 acetyl-CoA C-acetyltransferase [Leuconostocaceae bacterium R-53105]
MNFNQPVKIVTAKRLPIGKIHGSLSQYQPDYLYMKLIDQQFAQQSVLSLKQIDQIILGNVTNLGGNLARRCALKAGFSIKVPAQTIDCQCGSGLAAIINGANSIRVGDAKFVATGGVESTSQARPIIDPITKASRQRFPMTPSDMEDLDMGLVAEITSQKYQISRQEQDQYAWHSHHKAAQAQEKGQLIQEMIPIEGIELDQTVRPDCSLETLGQLKSAFVTDGRVTAGNSCPINDGASSVILANSDSEIAGEGYYLGQVSLGVAPQEFLIGPIKSTQALLAKYDLTMDDIQAVELNEAFAVQALLFQRCFALSDEKLNGWGGALAFGHPYGATGGILVARLLNRLNQIDRPALGIATMCVAGGMGISLLIANRAWSAKL